jgi:hypothetical protein
VTPLRAIAAVPDPAPAAVDPPALPDEAAAAAEFREAAVGHALEALNVLMALAKDAKSEAVRVSAAKAVIDRAHGRAPQAAKAGGRSDHAPGETVILEWRDPPTW